MDNTETLLATLGTYHTGRRQKSKRALNRIMDNTETLLATLGTYHTGRRQKSKRAG